MVLINFKNYDFRYKCDSKNAISNINLEIFHGEFVLLCGPSGSGKTTLLTSIKKEIRPAGEYNGSISYDGKNIELLENERSASEIGFLFQNPEDQFVSDTVIQEISFSLENIGLPNEEIRNRIAEMTAFFGLEKYLHKKVDELSGGQKQLVNLCSLLVLKPKLLLLDEPTSQLDPIAAHDLLSMLRRLNEDFSITIITTEHKTDNIFPLVDKTIFLEDGRIKYMNQPREICSIAGKDPIFSHYLPSSSKIHLLLKHKYPFLNDHNIPLNIREGRSELNFLDKKLKESNSKTILMGNKTELIETKKEQTHDPILKCKNLWFGYLKDQLILRDISFDISCGEFICILGGNGTGKTTLLQILSGILMPKKGQIKLKENVKMDYVHQNPMIHFRHEKVSDELSKFSSEFLEDNFTHESSQLFKKFEKMFNKMSSKPCSTQYIETVEKKELIDLFGISELLDKHPYDCSGGEKQKIAIVKALLTKPDILFLDEPTKGLDPISKANLGNMLKTLQKNGLTVVMTTHDIDFAAEYSERCMVLFDGSVQIDNIPKMVFPNNQFYTTSVNRLLKDYLPDTITLDDVKKEIGYV